jgi:hypothetical protein
MKMAIFIFFYHHGSKRQGIFTISKCGGKFKILKCSKQTLSPFPSNLLKEATTICHEENRDFNNCYSCHNYVKCMDFTTEGICQ